MKHFEIRQGHALDVLRALPDESVNCCVTSPPYWALRDYGTAKWEGGSAECDHAAQQIRRGLGLAASPASTRGGGKKIAKVGFLSYPDVCAKCGAVRVDDQIGLERTPEEYVAKLVEVFREIRRVLRNNGTLWMNMGDSYANDGIWGGETGGKQAYLDDNNRKRIGREKRFTGLKAKDLVGIPWRVAFALQADGWWLRSDIIWSKPNPMPESVTDRPTKAHEYIFLLAKSERYYYDAESVKEPGSADTHARYARGRSDEHKWCDGGPGNQTIAKSFQHMVKKPSGWNDGPTAWDKVGRYKNAPGVNPKAAQNAGGSRQNASFSAAVKDIVEFRNKRSVWTVSTCPTPEAHFATYPIDLIEPCILAGCPENGVVLDPFSGAATTGLAALKHGRRYLGIELNPQYIEISYQRARKYYPLLLNGAEEPEALAV